MLALWLRDHRSFRATGFVPRGLQLLGIVRHVRRLLDRRDVNVIEHRDAVLRFASWVDDWDDDARAAAFEILRA